MEIFLDAAVGVEIPEEADGAFHSAEPTDAVFVVVFGDYFVLELGVNIFGVEFAMAFRVY